MERIYINQFTMTSGRNKISYPEELESSLYSDTLKVITPAIGSTEPVCFMEDNIYLRILKEEQYYVATIYVDTGINPDKPDLLPLLSTGGAKDEESRARLIQLFTETYAGQLNSWMVFPEAPIIIDRIDITGDMSIAFAKIFKWTGGFSRCLGWVLLFPELIEGLQTI